MKKYEYLDKAVSWIVKSIAVLVFLILVLITFFLAKQAIPFLGSVHAKSLLSSRWRPLSSPPSFGLLPMLAGALYIGIGASVLALPLALGASLVISQGLRGRSKAVTLAFIEMLAGVPSVVYGLIGFFTIVKFLEYSRFLAAGESVFAAIITLAVMNTPYMLTGFVRTLDNIDRQYGTQTRALGVSRWYALSRLGLPVARAGIVNGYMVSLSKALGETMAVMMVVGNSPLYPRLFGKGITLSGVIALEMGASQLDSLHYQSLYMAGILLLILLLIVNALVRKLERWLNDG